MEIRTRLYFYDNDGNRYFGEGPYRLLRGIEQEGSLRKAAQRMDMGYTKALRMIHQMEASLGVAVTRTVIGGASGGGSELTEEGREWLQRYEAFREACTKANESFYREFFPELDGKGTSGEA